jgi:hypothetical protein
MFDDWDDPGDREVAMRSRRLDAARAGGAVIVPVQERWPRHPTAPASSRWTAFT